MRRRSSSRSPNSGFRSTYTNTRPLSPNSSTLTGNTYKSPTMTSGLGSTLVTGMAFGAGSQVAHNLVRGVTGSGGRSYVQNQQQNIAEQQPVNLQQAHTSIDPCIGQIQNLSKCLDTNQDISECQSLFQNLKQCKSQQMP